MTKVQTLIDELQDGYRTKSIINDSEKKGISNTFSEASRRTIKELGNIEFFELRDFQNSSMPTVLEVFQRRNSLLLVRNMSYVFAGTNRKDQ